MTRTKILSLILSICFVVSGMTAVASPVSAEENTQTYGYDNIYDTTKDLTVAYLGGSITEQRGYVENSFEYFSDLKESQGKKANFIKAGIGGTPSDLGLYRLQHQILDKNPDVLFVEFAVNDRYRGDSAAKDMEGIVRMCMTAPHQPCVIFLISAQENFDSVAAMAARYKTVAEYYNVGFVDFAAYLRPLVDNGIYVWDGSKSNSLTDDGTHPNDAGSKVYGEYIKKCLTEDTDNILKKLNFKVDALSQYVHGKPKMVPHNDPAIKYTGDGWIVSNGTSVPNGSRVSPGFLNYPRFEAGYHEFKTYDNMGENAPTIEYNFKGRSIGIFADRGDSGAKFKYVIDENTIKEKSGIISNYYKHQVKQDITETAVGAQMTCSTFLVEGLEYGDHTIKITLMDPVKENFIQNLFAFGYFMVDEERPLEVPTALDVKVSGKKKTEQLLTASYTFKNMGNASGKEGSSKYAWLRSDTKNGTYVAIDGATALQYTTTNDDKRKYIKFEVTPVNENGVTGAKTCSEPMYIRDANNVNSELDITVAKLGNTILSETADDAPEINISAAKSSAFNISGSIDDFGYDVTMRANDYETSSKIIAYSQKTASENDGQFAFTMKPSPKIEKGKTYEISIGGKNVAAPEKFYFKTSVLDGPKVVIATIEEIQPQTYTGSKIEPAVKAFDGGMEIPEDEYEVLYENNENAGTATVTLVDKENGNYTVSGSTTFIIKPAAPFENAEKKTTARVAKGKTLAAATITAGEFLALDKTTPLKGTFEWIESTKAIDSDSKEQLKFIPENPNYESITIEVAVSVYTPSSGGGGGSSVSRYTVKFETNGGSSVANQTVTKNSAAKEPSKPTKDGYTFVGWYSDKELTEKYDFSEKVTKSITLYAKWSEGEEKEPSDDKPTTDNWKNPFNDVNEGDWFYDSVKYANENNLMGGTKDTEFAPNLTLTRGMLVTILYRMAGEPAVNKSIPFGDVSAESYYTNAVIWAQQNGIVSGINESEFAPEDNITREQIAVIIYRFAKDQGYDVSSFEDTNILSYTDFDEISEYAIEAMQYAVGSSLINGKTESTLNPKENATRAEIAAILQRFIQSNK